MGECPNKIRFDSIISKLDLETEKLVGEVLTILESSLADNRQCFAAKRMAKKAIWQLNHNIKDHLLKDLEVLNGSR